MSYVIKNRKAIVLACGGKFFTGRGLRLGLLMVALFGLSCLAFAQGAWHAEVVDGGSGADVGKSASMVIDPAGDFHIGYFDASAHMLRYAFRSHLGGKWYLLPVPGTKNAYPYLSLAVDAQGHPHFAYESEDDGLSYAHWDGKTWHKFVIDNVRAAYYNSIQLDSQGHPRISYYQEYSGSPKSSVADSRPVLHLKYAFFDGHQWFIQTVDWAYGSGKYNSMAVDGNGNAHIAYERIGAGELLYVQGGTRHWQFGAVDPGAQYRHTVGPGVSIALDRSSNPHLAYLDITADLVKYAAFQNGKWKFQVVDHLAGRALLDHVSLRLDSQNRAHIAYYDAGMGALKYAVETTSGFRVAVVDRDGNVGMSPSLCLDAHDQPYIAYYDVSRRLLKFAYLEKGSTVSVASANSK